MKKSFNEEQIREFIFHFFSEKIFLSYGRKRTSSSK